LQDTSGKTKERLEEVHKNVQDIKQKIKDGDNEIPNLDQQTVELKEKKNLVRLLIFLHGMSTPCYLQYVVYKSKVS
jgi:septal ring factor EnvC (AmiA/AmiB activator)